MGLYAEDMDRLYHGRTAFIQLVVAAATMVVALVGASLLVSYIGSLAPPWFWDNPWIRGIIGAILWAAIAGVGGLYLTWLERKVMARIQVRYGPNRWGKYGLLQPFADAIKLLTKEDVILDAADKAVFRAAPIVAFAPAFLAFAAVPVTAELIVSRTDIGILFIIAVSSLTPIGAIMAGWGPNNKWNLIGGMRFAAQMISYEVPMVLAIIGPIALARSLNGVTIVMAQAGYWFGFIPKWYVFLQPLGFLIFLIAFMAETCRIPFDLPEAENELVGGWITEYSGMKFVMLLLVEYVHLIAGGALVVVLFLGGWQGPFLPPLAWFMIKLLAVIFFMMLVRATHFRTRIDQLLALGWKVLLPLALLNIGITGIILALTV
ncbi:MAG: NADH-quinone oxidoreductase subunit NuoH [Candidatus Hydrothermarchaeales archaeon]